MVVLRDDAISASYAWQVTQSRASQSNHELLSEGVFTRAYVLIWTRHER